MKIETIRGTHGTIIRLIGGLEADYIAELNVQIEAAGRDIVLEMDEVTLVDVEVVRFLVACEARGIELRRCPAYIREWMAREQDSEA